MKNSKLFSLKIFDCHSRNDLVKEFLNSKIQNFFFMKQYFFGSYFFGHKIGFHHIYSIANINIHELFHSVTFFGEKNLNKKNF